MPLLSMRGPEFLLFYALLAVTGCAWLRYTIARWELKPADRILAVRDPYEIAYLRGGIRGLVQVVALSLIRRRLLIANRDGLETRAMHDAQTTATPVERAVLQCCIARARAADLKTDVTVLAAAEDYRRALVRSGLMPDDSMRRLRHRRAALVFVLLALLACTKLVYALATGHRNVGFLMLLTVLAGVVLFKIANLHRTGSGDRAVAGLETLFARVKRGALPLQADQHHEALLLAAVFGVYAVPGVDPASWRRLFGRSDAGGGTGGGDGGSGGGDAGGCGGGGGCGGCGS